MTKLKEEFKKYFDDNCKCINSDCNNNGTIAEQVRYDEWEPRQCQFCYEYRFPLREKLSSKLDEIEKEVMGLLPKYLDEEVSLCEKKKDILKDIYSCKGYNSAIQTIRERITKYFL